MSERKRNKLGTKKKKRAKAKSKSDWRFVSDYPITKYQCGAVAGDRVRLRRKLVIRDFRGKPTGEVYPADEIWTVLRGADEETIVVWMRQPDWQTHTWDDNDEFWTWFGKVV